MTADPSWKALAWEELASNPFDSLHPAQLPTVLVNGQQYGGSLAAPGWGDLADWWTALVSDTSGDAYHRSLRRRFAFLDEIVPRVPVLACRRATATITSVSPW